MLERNELLSLMKATAKASRSNPVAYSFNGENLSYDALNETLRKELNELAGTFALYRENKNTIFSLIEETMDDVLPKKVVENYGQFAEVKTVAQGDKAIFMRKHDRRRAKQFITKVGLAGIYEVFKLGKDTPIEMQTNAIGGAAQIGLEEFLDGRADFAEVTSIVMEGLDDLIYQEIGQALKTGINQLPTANKVSTTGFDEASFDRLLAVCSAYGDPTIYCTEEFASTIRPADGSFRWSDNMKDVFWNNGRFASYKNHPIVILPQGVTDASNETKVIDSSMCYILPGSVKPAKVVMEGGTIVDEYVNKDRSREIQVYKKVGVGVVMTPDICVYENAALKSMSMASSFAVQENPILVNVASETTTVVTFTQVAPVGTENPSTEGWYEVSNGKYVASKDTEVTDGKTYFEKN